MRTWSGADEHWLNQLRSNCFNSFGQDIWLESLRLNTTMPGDDRSEDLPADALEQLRQVIAELESDDQRLSDWLEKELRSLDKRLPAALKIGDQALQLTKPAFGRPLLSRILPILTHLENVAKEPS